MTQNEWRKRFSERLLTILSDRNMTRVQLAKESGLSPSRISDYINLNATPTPFAALNIAHALDISVNDLVDFDERITP